MSPESNIYDLFFVHKIPSGQLSRIYIQKSTEPGQTPSKTYPEQEKKLVWIFLRFLIVGKKKNADFVVIFNKSRDSNFEGGAYCWGLCAFTKHTQRDTFRDINEYKMAMVSFYFIFGLQYEEP